MFTETSEYFRIKPYSSRNLTETRIVHERVKFTSPLTDYITGTVSPEEFYDRNNPTLVQGLWTMNRPVDFLDHCGKENFKETRSYILQEGDEGSRMWKRPEKKVYKSGAISI